MEYDVHIDRPWPGTISDDTQLEIHIAVESTDGVTFVVTSSRKDEISATVLVRADSFDEACTLATDSFDAAIAVALTM